MHIYLRAWRKRRGLTLEALADLIGSRANTLSGWERGNRAVDLNDLNKLAKVYGVHPAALLMAPEDHDRTEKMRAAADLVARLPEDAAAAWLAIGRRMVKPD